MDTRFLGHNLHLTSVATFEESDPQLSRLNKQSYIYYSPLLERLPVTDPGIYTLGGGRQIGKSTLLKQWMLKLLRDFHVEPQKIAFFTGEIIDDHHSLLSLLQSQLGKMQCDHNSFGYVIIDEITYIKNWDKAIKYAADLGYFENVILILTGSDLILMQAAKMRFPGRRGKADLVDFHMYPLSFKEVLNLKNITNITHIDPNLLLQEFLNYLQHGGYLMAINDLKSYGKILPATFQTYADWIRGDILKKGKQESYLREIIGAIIKRYGSQITWNSLAKDLSIDHHKTVADYIELLVSMDVVFIQSALIEDKLVGAPKKVSQDL
jgi:predicted AAA+ superfamily ATPase